MGNLYHCHRTSSNEKGSRSIGFMSWERCDVRLFIIGWDYSIVLLIIIPKKALTDKIKSKKKERKGKKRVWVRSIHSQYVSTKWTRFSYERTPVKRLWCSFVFFVLYSYFFVDDSFHSILLYWFVFSLFFISLPEQTKSKLPQKKEDSRNKINHKSYVYRCGMTNTNLADGMIQQTTWWSTDQGDTGTVQQLNRNSVRAVVCLKWNERDTDDKTNTAAVARTLVVTVDP